MPRLSLYKSTLVLCFLISAYCLWKSYKYFHKNEEFQHTCNMPEAYRNQLELLVERVHIILKHHSLTHFMCYGTLWGQIKMDRISPWSKNAEFCILEEEISKIKQQDMREAFRNVSLNLLYQPYDGVFRIQNRAHSNPEMKLITFQKDEMQNVYKRVGWKYRLLPPDCEWTPSLECFPAVLLTTTTNKKLGNYSYPAPLGSIEIQKYHYPDNWWKDTKIKNCNK